MEKLKQDLNIFILDDSNVHRTVATIDGGLELGCGGSPVRISFTPPPIHPQRGSSPAPAIMLNRIVPIGCVGDRLQQSSQLKIIDTTPNAIQMGHVTTLGNSLEAHLGGCHGAVGIDSNNIESLISDEDCDFPQNEISGTYVH